MTSGGKTEAASSSTSSSDNSFSIFSSIALEDDTELFFTATFPAGFLAGLFPTVAAGFFITGRLGASATFVGSFVSTVAVFGFTVPADLPVTTALSQYSLILVSLIASKSAKYCIRDFSPATFIAVPIASAELSRTVGSKQKLKGKRK